MVDGHHHQHQIISNTASAEGFCISSIKKCGGFSPMNVDHARRFC